MRADDLYPDGAIGRKLLPFMSTQYHWPFVGVVPIILVTTYLPLGPGNMSIFAFAACFALGWLLWTFGEYLMHRFGFHYKPRTKWGKLVLHYLHEGHHEDPKLKRLILVPVVLSVPILTGWAVLGYYTIGYPGVAILAGHAVGYLYYEHVHYSCHHARFRVGWTKMQRKTHMYHHFKDHDRWYGVSTRLWDYVFRTHVPKAETNRAMAALRQNE